LGQTHYPVLGNKGPRREPPAIPSVRPQRKDFAPPRGSRKPMTVVELAEARRSDELGDLNDIIAGDET
jgi:hypothetical protein